MNDHRVLAHDLEAEQIALGSMLRSEEAIPIVRELVQPEDFFSPKHRAICQAIFDLVGGHQPTDLAAVDMVLRDRGRLEEVGGQDYTGGPFDSTPGPSGAKYYAQRVRDKAIARKVIALCEREADKARSPEANVSELVAGLQADAYSLIPGSDGRGVVTLGQAVKAVLARAERVFNGDEPAAVMTGFEDIDRAMGGFSKGDLITLAADTSAGKTTLAANIAENVATDGGTVLVVSREMEFKELGKRFLQSRSGVHGHKIKFARSLQPEDWAKLQLADAQLEKLRVALDDRSTTVEDIALTARQWVAKWGSPFTLLVVDYLQLMDYERGQHRRGENTAHAVGRFAWGLKQMAMDLGTPVLMLSQLNRQGVTQDRPPTLHSLKESGDIENHSTGVILLYRPADAQVERDGSFRVWAQVAKARDGCTTPWEGQGALRLRWRPTVTRFEPLPSGVSA